MICLPPSLSPVPCASTNFGQDPSMKKKMIMMKINPSLSPSLPFPHVTADLPKFQVNERSTGPPRPYLSFSPPLSLDHYQMLPIASQYRYSLLRRQGNHQARLAATAVKHAGKRVAKAPPFYLQLTSVSVSSPCQSPTPSQPCVTTLPSHRQRIAGEGKQRSGSNHGYTPKPDIISPSSHRLEQAGSAALLSLPSTDIAAVQLRWNSSRCHCANNARNCTHSVDRRKKKKHSE